MDFMVGVYNSEFKILEYIIAAKKELPIVHNNLAKYDWQMIYLSSIDVS
jgi:hypothetical protein